MLVSIVTYSQTSLGQSQLPSVADVRNSIEGEIYSFKIPPEKIFKVENKSLWSGADSIKIRIYYPNNKKKQRIIFNIHGGALIACDLNTHDNICRILSNKTKSVVVAVDYKKPPEFPFPAGINDCEFVLQWIKGNANSLNGDANNIVLTGESGGGLFVAALGVKLQNNLGVKKIVLINPAIDLRNYEQGPYALVCSWYLNKKDANDSLVSPITATKTSFFPPTLIVTSEKDYLKQQGTDFFTKLSSDGVNVKIVDITNQDHLGGYWAAGHTAAQQAIKETVNFIIVDK